MGLILQSSLALRQLLVASRLGVLCRSLDKRQHPSDVMQNLPRRCCERRCLNFLRIE